MVSGQRWTQTSTPCTDVVRCLLALTSRSKLDLDLLGSSRARGGLGGGSVPGRAAAMDTGTIAEAIMKAVARDGPDPDENMRLAFELCVPTPMSLPRSGLELTHPTPLAAGGRRGRQACRKA